MIERIENKILELKQLDKEYRIFGSNEHKYEFKSPITKYELNLFQELYEIELPEQYRNFILHFGSEGCGPHYGLIPIEQAVKNQKGQPQDAEFIAVSKPFKFKEFWNQQYTNGDYGAWETNYFKAHWIDGALRISHEGCGYYTLLIVTGNEKGNIWKDARASDGGIYPDGHYQAVEKTTFEEWYLNWLNKSIDKIKKTGNT